MSRTLRFNAWHAFGTGIFKRVYRKSYAFLERFDRRTQAAHKDKRRMSHEDFVAMAKKYPPPQEWFDEDFSALRGKDVEG